MIEKSANEIVDIVKNLSLKNKDWHFHILSPDCIFNTKNKFVLVVEAPENMVYVNYSDTKQAVEGEMLLKLLHNINTDEVDVDKVGYKPAKKVLMIVKRAKELTKKGISWHHHVLFPNCMYNTSGKWLLMLEDPETKKVIESVTENKPVEDIKLVEPLFYRQK